MYLCTNKVNTPFFCPVDWLQRSFFLLSVIVCIQYICVLLVTCRAWFGASLSSRRMFSLFVELILKLSFAVSPLSALELMYIGVTNLYRQ